MGRITEWVRETEGLYDPLCGVGVVAALAFYPLLSAWNPQPKASGHKPVVEMEGLVYHSWGYDFNGDGKLDYARK